MNNIIQNKMCLKNNIQQMQEADKVRAEGGQKLTGGKKIESRMRKRDQKQ